MASRPESIGESLGRSPISEWLLEVDERTFRRVMGRFATGITVITTRLDGEVYGMTANAFMAGSLEPPLCVTSVGRRARMHDRLRQSGSFGVSVLGADQQHLSNHFAGRAIVGLQPDFRFLAGIPVLAGAIATVAATIVDSFPCGDHTCFVGRTFSMAAASGEPLLFYGGRYRSLDKVHRIEETEPPAFW